jgi:hypothetical protein
MRATVYVAAAVSLIYRLVIIIVDRLRRAKPPSRA